jgi:hypothetical protein
MEQLPPPAQALSLDLLTLLLDSALVALVMVLALEAQDLGKARDQGQGRTQALVLVDPMGIVAMAPPALAKTTAQRMQHRHCGERS